MKYKGRSYIRKTIICKIINGFIWKMTFSRFFSKCDQIILSRVSLLNFTFKTKDPQFWYREEPTYSSSRPIRRPKNISMKHSNNSWVPRWRYNWFASKEKPRFFRNLSFVPLMLYEKMHLTAKEKKLRHLDNALKFYIMYPSQCVYYSGKFV